MPKHGKNYRNAIGDRDVVARVDVAAGVATAVAGAYAKFDETVDVAINLGVDPKYSDQMIRGAVSLPNGLGKDVRVVVFCKPEKEAEAMEAGADIAGSDELAAKIQGGWLDFDKAVATPDMMAVVGKIGRVLGPRGLMPNAKTGTVTMDVAKAVTELKAGKVDFKVDKAGIVHAPIGKVSFGAEKLCENLRTLLSTIVSMKPSSAKGTYMQAVGISTTMGPGIKIDPVTVKKFLDV
ncbi:MAG: 50S ribosomal protein L1 [Pseudodesulfovibrio sp.]